MRRSSWIRMLRASLIFTVTTCAVSIGFSPGPAEASSDHLRCYKIRDPQKLQGIVGLNSPEFGVVAGCSISSARLYCVPATNTGAFVKVDKMPFLPLPVRGAAVPGDRLCYRVKCRDDKPVEELITDQFGTRDIVKFKDSFVCTPAVKGAEYCGDGVTNGTDECDTTDDSACPGLCNSDCTCAASCPDPPECTCGSVGESDAGFYCGLSDLPPEFATPFLELCMPTPQACFEMEAALGATALAGGSCCY